MMMLRRICHDGDCVELLSVAQRAFACVGSLSSIWFDNEMAAAHHSRTFALLYRRPVL